MLSVSHPGAVYSKRKMYYMGMKVGVLGCFFDCAELLPQVLAPWKSLKSQGYPFVLGAMHVQFYEYKDLGLLSRDEPTHALLKNDKAIDIFRFSGEPLFEKAARQMMLEELLRRGVDAIWLLDGDEIYTEEQIKGILAYVEKTPQFDYYHVHLDNRIFGTTKWADGFFPPRIFRTDRHGGIRVFTWDNELKYNDSSTLYSCIPGIVPKRIAHVLHHTWRARDAEKKIAYQHLHFGYCPFKLEAGKLVFDEAYFTRHSMPLPKISPDGSFAMAQKREVPVAYRRDGARSAQDNERALIHLISALLVLERQNGSHITLTLESPSATAQEKELLDICPFDTAIAPIAPLDAFPLSADDCLHGPAFIFSMIESHFMKAPAELATV
jgi:hypothetical protein